MNRRIENRQLVDILALFLIVQFLGIFLIFFSLPPWAISLITSSTAPTTGASQALLLLVYMIVASIILVVVLKRYHGELLYKALEAYVVGVPSFFIFLIVIGRILPSLPPSEATLPAAAGAIFLIYAKSRNPGLRNATTIISSVGIGIVIGMYGFSFSYLLMMLVAVYDYVAVFITKHMQVMARAMASRNLSFLIGSSDVSLVSANAINAKDRKEAMRSASALSTANPVLKKYVKRGSIPVMSQIMLGAGDLAIPLTLSVGAYISFGGLFVPVMIAIGAAVGVMATMLLLRKYMVPLPAIPPLFAFINIFLAAAFLLKPALSAGMLPLAFLIVSASILVIIYFTLESHPLKSEEGKAPK